MDNQFNVEEARNALKILAVEKASSLHKENKNEECLKPLINDIKNALKNGATKKEIYAALKANGLNMGIATFNTTVKKLGFKARKYSRKEIKEEGQEIKNR